MIRIVYRWANLVHCRNFVYDGEGPDAFFTVGVRSRRPNGKDAIPIR
jgi:hypothetical protein